FKEYNDKYGHPAGDILLKGLSKEFRRKIKAGDVAARYGGEEFALVLPRRSKQEAVELAESIRESIEKKEFFLRKEKTRITISMGVVTFPMDAMMKQDLIRRADEALYRAKEKGRNRVEVC
ncbi:MAG: GGDEF domain-containing protein, partial [Candidatus Omnitrophica bacterium]|nr:GGDEF domain-containing protein [Candidatus Omnitrophota bacterium]